MLKVPRLCGVDGGTPTGDVDDGKFAVQRNAEDNTDERGGHVQRRNFAVGGGLFLLFSRNKNAQQKLVLFEYSQNNKLLQFKSS